MKVKFLITVVLLSGILLLPLISSCHSEYRLSLEVPAKINTGSPLVFTVKEASGQKIDKVEYTLDGKPVTSPLDITGFPVGKHELIARVVYGNESQTLSRGIIFLAANPYKIYDFKIIHTYPHDINAYTQGLEYEGGYLYESTGRKGQSSLRKVEIESGKVIQKTDVPPAYFAEGMTLWKDKIIQLTWQSGKGFIYDKKTFKKTGEFKYGNSREGWGLTHDDTVIYKSDGTEKIYLLDPENLQEKGSIACYTNKAPVKELNELEYINGKIYANVWMKNVIIIIDPRTGAVEGVADMNRLVKEMANTQHLGRDDVLNGIAYDAKNDRLFVTGKYWGELFEIQLVERK